VDAVYTVFDLSLDQLLIRAGACIIVVAIHGVVLAATARALGDRGPQFDERLTLNPLNHLDVIGAATMILFQLGWIRPVAIDPAELRLGRVGPVVCAGGSLALTLVIVELLLRLRVPALVMMPVAIAPSALATLNATAEMVAWFVAFNLLPLPPLTGANLAIAVRPSLLPLFARYRLQIALAVAALVVSGLVQPIIRPIRDAILVVLP
jgi:Zn-dependent protease